MKIGGRVVILLPVVVGRLSKNCSVRPLHENLSFISCYQRTVWIYDKYVIGNVTAIGPQMCNRDRIAMKTLVEIMVGRWPERQLTVEFYR